MLLGRRQSSAKHNAVRYRRIRERELASFRADYTGQTRTISHKSFLRNKGYSFRIPDLEELWELLSENPQLSNVSELGQGLVYHSASLPKNGLTYSKARFPDGQKGFVLFDRGIQLHQLPEEYWMNLDSRVIRRPQSGTKIGKAQVLLNYAPASRGPWRLKALIDTGGHPVTSRFIPIRASSAAYSITVLWALLNSPIANAYVFSHLGKRDNIVGEIRKIPLPKNTSFVDLETAANRYLRAVRSGTDLLRVA